MEKTTFENQNNFSLNDFFQTDISQCSKILIHHFHRKSYLNFRDLVLVIFKHCVNKLNFFLKIFNCFLFMDISGLSFWNTISG